jgi:hypothetical protein
MTRFEQLLVLIALGIALDIAMWKVGVIGADGAGTMQEIQTSSSDYYPHMVKFTVIDRFGSPLVQINVSAYMYKTESINQFAARFGLVSDPHLINNLSIQGVSLQGITDNDGAVVFAMIAPEKYAITITNTTLGVNDTYLLYPAEDYYKIFTGVG